MANQFTASPAYTDISPPYEEKYVFVRLPSFDEYAPVETPCTIRQEQEKKIRQEQERKEAMRMKMATIRQEQEEKIRNEMKKVEPIIKLNIGQMHQFMQSSQVQFSISFSISLNNITLFQNELSLVLFTEQSGYHIHLCDLVQACYLSNTSGYRSPEEKSGKTYGTTCNVYVVPQKEEAYKYNPHSHPYSNIWLQFVEKSDIGQVLGGSSPDLIKTVAKMINDKVNDMKPKFFRYMRQI